MPVAVLSIVAIVTPSPMHTWRLIREVCMAVSAHKTIGVAPSSSMRMDTRSFKHQSGGWRVLRNMICG
jgi:hypothetical protein